MSMEEIPETEPQAEASVKPRRQRKSRKKWIFIGLAAVVLLAGVGVGSFLLLRPSGNASAQGFSRTVEVTKADQTLSVSFDGTLSPSKESDVNFAISGTVTSVKVKAGNKVTKGQVLATIDKSDLQDAVDLATANVTTAKANLTEVKDNDGSSAAIKSAKAQVTSAEAALTTAEKNLDEATLTSPIEGTIASVDVEVGDTVAGSSSSSSSSSKSSSSSSSSGSSSSSSSSSSSTQFVVISTAKWKVEGSVGASDLSSLKAGQSAVVTTDATTSELKGTVSSVGIVATSTSDGSATFPVVINLSGTHNDLYSGTTASATITTGTYKNVLTVPTAAIKTENSKTVVTKVANGTNTTTEVQVGTVFGNYTQIKSGLSEGDAVLISFTRPTSTSTSSSGSQGQGGFGGGSILGGGGGSFSGGGGAPPAGGGSGGGR